jgi:hypothetical protein
MVGNKLMHARGVISPGVPEDALIHAWETRIEAPIAPETKLVTDGKKFEITFRDVWPPENLKHAFELVVRQVSNLRNPGTPQRIDWSE